MNPGTICQRCGAEVTTLAVGGLCGNCLLKLALEPPHDEASVTQPASAEHYFGDYQLMEMIGRGGMGVVYKARQKHLNRTVALKMVQNWRDASLDTLARFQIEARAAARLDHPNIVPTYQIGELRGQPFFSMKLVPGVSLSRKMRELALVKPGKARTTGASPRLIREAQVAIAGLLAKVARAVHYAHQQGVIHRDLKPSNILIDPDGEPHLTDFGVAKLVEQDCGLTRTHEMLGTPAYMAPEQAAGKAISPAVDIYSLGAILYELLTGQTPFRGKSPLETLRKAAEEEPVPPSTMNGSTDAELAAICLKCLEKGPMHRYGSALGVAEDLERWMRREPIHARRAGLFSRTIRWAQRNPEGASLIATLCAGLAVTLGLLSMVNAEKVKNAAILRENELLGRSKDYAISIAVAKLQDRLETLWLMPNQRSLEITSEEAAILSSRDVPEVIRKTSIERFSFGLAANENPVADVQKYAELLARVERRLTEKWGRPVRIDLKIFKYKEDRLQALLTNGVDFARMGDIYFLKMKEENPGFEALVTQDSRLKRAVFFTRTNTGISTLADLKGRSVAFGDPFSGLTLWGQDKLVSSGITGKDLASYVFLNSRSEFDDEVQAFGYQTAINSRGWLHSTADVIDEVLKGNYNAGVTSLRGFEKHKHLGLQMIDDSEFERALSPWVARKGFPAEVARDFVEALTSIQNEAFLLLVPGRPSGFSPVNEESFDKVRKAMKRIQGLFPRPTNQTNQSK